MTATAAALKRLEALFQDVKLDDAAKSATQRKRSSIHEHVHFSSPIVEVDSKDCDIHGRRGSMGNILSARRDSLGRRDSIPGINAVPAACLRRRDSLVLGSGVKDLSHVSSFPSSLRKDSTTTSSGSLLRKDSNGSTGRRDSSVSNTSLRKDSRKDSLNSNASLRKDSLSRRRFSTDSLDGASRRHSWDPSRRGSSGSSGGWEDPIYEEGSGIVINKVMTTLIILCKYTSCDTLAWFLPHFLS